MDGEQHLTLLGNVTLPVTAIVTRQRTIISLFTRIIMCAGFRELLQASGLPTPFGLLALNYPCGFWGLPRQAT